MNGGFFSSLTAGVWLDVHDEGERAANGRQLGVFEGLSGFERRPFRKYSPIARTALNKLPWAKIPAMPITV